MIITGNFYCAFCEIFIPRTESVMQYKVSEFSYITAAVYQLDFCQKIKYTYIGFAFLIEAISIFYNMSDFID